MDNKRFTLYEIKQNPPKKGFYEMGLTCSLLHSPTFKMGYSKSSGSHSMARPFRNATTGMNSMLLRLSFPMIENSLASSGCILCFGPFGDLNPSTFRCNASSFTCLDFHPITTPRDPLTRSLFLPLSSRFRSSMTWKWSFQLKDIGYRSNHKYRSIR
jgi:hypothetical protein